MLIQLSKLSCAIFAATFVAGCANTPLKQNLPPQQAMTQAYAQLYKTASYQFAGQMKVDQIDVSPVARADKKDAAHLASAPGMQETIATDIEASRQAYIDAYLSAAKSKADSAGKPLNAKQLKEVRQKAEVEAVKALSLKPAQKLTEKNNLEKSLPNEDSGTPRDNKVDAMMQDLIKVYSERYRFNYSGVVDLRHKKLEITPEFRYESRNMGGYIRVPMLADLSDAKLYADLSALSPWLVNTQSEGKYTRIDWKAQQDKVDVNKAFELIRDSALASYQLGELSNFKDSPLSKEERALGAARKIQFESPLSQYIAKLATYLAVNKQSFQQLLLKEPSQASAKEDIKQVPEPMDAAAVKALLKNQPEMYADILKKVEEKMDASSRFTQEALLDTQGRVIQSNWHAYIVSKDADKYNVKLKLSNQINFSKYGSAAVSYQPKEGNWVDLKSSMNNSLFGGFFNKGLLGGLGGSGLADLGKSMESPDFSGDAKLGKESPASQSKK